MKLSMRVVLLTVGILIGSVAGLLYWKFIGCESGSCSISSSPYISTLYGAILGGLLFSIFRIEKKDKQRVNFLFCILFLSIHLNTYFYFIFFSNLFKIVFVFLQSLNPFLRGETIPMNMIIESFSGRDITYLFTDYRIFGSINKNSPLERGKGVS